MKRTISAMVGKGSVNHNSRKFKAENVHGERTNLNIDYCNEPIKQVYHKLFDEALERYNAKQTRADRRIDDYYEKIRAGKQEKPFHELILQIGNRDDTGAETEIGEQTKAALAEYYQGFQERNPNLYVFSAHLHMDEATPHIHIDFVPFTTGSSRGLDTRVSLKKALAAQGFQGGSRGATEWSQWVQSEKEQLARVMERHGFEWEQRGTHEEHLSVIEYKKQERTKELTAVETKLTYKVEEFNALARRINNLEKGEHDYSEMEQKLASDPEYQLPEPQGLMTAKAYKTKYADPLVKRLKKLVKNLLVRYFKAMDNYFRLNKTNGELNRDNEALTQSNDRLKEENTVLREQNKDYALLRKVFGSIQIDDLVAQAKEAQQAKRRQRQKSYRSAADGQRTILEKEKKNFENNRNIVLAFRFAKGKYRETLENVRNALYSALEDNVRVAEQEEHEAARQKEEKYQEFLQKKDLEVEELYQKKLAERENVYLGLCKEFENANESYRFRTLKERFQFLGDYKDCEEYVKKCDSRIAELEEIERKERIERSRASQYASYSALCSDTVTETLDNLETAKAGFESLGEYRDAPARAQKCAERIEQIKKAEEAKVKAAAEEAERQRIARERAAAEEAERQRIARERAAAVRKKKKRIIGIVSALVIVLSIAAVLIVTKVIIPEQKLNKALGLLDSGDYEAAYALLEEIGNSDAIASSKYDRAVALLDSGDYEEAYMLLNGLDYMDSASKLSSIKPQYQKILLSKAQVGSYVYFGSYDQNPFILSSKDDIEWLVLAKEGNRILLISRYALLDRQPYNTISNTDVTWETSSLRKWLNETFLNDAFSKEEQAIIPSVVVSADKNPNASKSVGNSTRDKVFLLSITEANKYFASDSARQCQEIAYCYAPTASRSSFGNCWWWLRTNGDSSEFPAQFAAYVKKDGSINYHGTFFNSAGWIRPALWVDLG